MIAYPVFLLVLMIPALEFLLERLLVVQTEHESARTLSLFSRRLILATLLLASVLQAIYFQKVFRRDGPQRDFYFDVDYKTVYDEALKQPNRPVYLLDGANGPVYMDGLWYAVVEGRNRADFIHLEEGTRAPAGTVVISSEETCFNCQIINKSGLYMVYRQF